MPKPAMLLENAEPADAVSRSKVYCPASALAVTLGVVLGMVMEMVSPQSSMIVPLRAAPLCGSSMRAKLTPRRKPPSGGPGVGQESII